MKNTSAWAAAHAPAGTRWGKKALSLLLSLVLCLGLLPGMALAAEGEDSTAESYGLWLGGEEITSANADSIFEDEGKAVVHYSLTEPGNPEAGGTLYIERSVWFAEDYTGGVTPATIYARYPLTIRLNGGLTVSTYNESAPAEKVGTGNIYCEDTLTVQGSIQTVGNQDYDLFVLGSVSAKSVTLEYAHLRSNAGSVTAREGDITLTGSCPKAANGAYTDGTCVSAANGAIIAKNAETRNSTECYKNGEQQEGFVSETNCLKNTTFVSELDNSPEQVEAPIIIPDRMNQGTTFIGTQEIYLFCDTAGAAIHYTLDGTKPTKNSTQYSGPFTIDKDCVVKAIAVKEGMADSDVVTSGDFIKVTGIDEPSIRFSPDGKAYPANDTISFGNSSKEYEYVLVPNYGAADDYANVSVSDKVAVVQRGKINFADKYKNAKNAGAIGLIIYNNEPGTFGAGLGDMSEGEKTIPLISTTREAGLAALNNTKDSTHGTLWIDPQQPGFKIKVCNVRYLTGEKHLLTGRVRFTALCGEGDFVTMDQDIVLDYEYTGFLPSSYWDNFDHWSCNDPNVSLTETPDDVDSPAAYDRLITIPDHDIQLIANWKDEALPAPHYKITFDLNYEGAPDTVEAVTGTDGKLAALLKDPVWSGYTFDGWYTADGEKVTVDTVYTKATTLYARWKTGDGTPIPTVTAYGLYGGTMGITPGDTYIKSYVEGAEVLLQIGMRDGYTLDQSNPLKLEGIDEVEWYRRTEEDSHRGISFKMPAENVTITVNWVKNGSSSGGGSVSTYAVSVGKTEHGSVTVSPKSAAQGATVTVTVAPDKGYALETLTATDKDGKALTLTRKSDTQYSFSMPASDVTVRAAFLEDNTMLNYFVDVKAGSYCYDAVLWAAERGITLGTDAEHFSPSAPCTRAQIVTFLWRAAGSPAPKATAMPFTDVRADSVYAKAILWAVERGITLGTTETTFSPDAPCTRAQAVMFLFRYAAPEAVTPQELVSGYADAASVPGYALPAMNWALAAGILRSDGQKLMPGDTCTRGQIVTFLHRALAK